MNAVEFQTTAHDGIINLPQDQQSWNGKKIRVILLEATQSTEPKTAMNHTDNETDFFQVAGIWQNRDITQASIRTEAWRANHS